MAVTLGPRLAEARKQRGWSLREAERRSGVPNAHISQVETGAIARPGVAVLIRLATAYKIPLPPLLALAGHVSFGDLDEHGHLEDPSGHDLWLISAWLPRGREGEVADWMAAHGIEVYRMWQPQADREDGDAPARHREAVDLPLAVPAPARLRPRQADKWLRHARDHSFPRCLSNPAIPLPSLGSERPVHRLP